MTVSLADIFARLKPYPHLYDQLSLVDLVRFIRCATILSKDILLTQSGKHPEDEAPQFLPRSVTVFFSELLHLPEKSVGECWLALKDLVWEGDLAAGLGVEPLSLFKQAGQHVGLTQHVFYPPTTTCINPTCQNRARLTEAAQISVVLHTIDKGSIPAHCIQLHCRGCRAAYHHNYYVSNNERIYYSESGVPDVIQVSTHRFVEARLVELWANSMLLAWMSASNCARLYNIVLAGMSHEAADFSDTNTPYLDSDEVWDSFILLSLLEDCIERETLLRLPHKGEQKDRFKKAMETFDVRVQRNGLGEVYHHCDKCTRFYDDPTNSDMSLKVSVVVVDGITIGHPCCAVHNCTTPLANQRHRFCDKHADLNNQCSIKGCDKAVVPGSHVCADPTHQAVQQRHFERGQARFQLQHRLEQARGTMPDFVPGKEGSTTWDDVLDSGEEEFDLDALGRVVTEEVGPLACPSKPATGNKCLRALFGRKRTHNEQIIVTPCGVIIARTTFYGSEGVSLVADFIKHVYEPAPQARPNHIIFDNNCTLAKYVKDDEFFKDIGLSVDVFHFNCKHSTSDTFCQENCNPRAFPELISDNGGWQFNSSIAEQTNVWLGGVSLNLS